MSGAAHARAASAAAGHDGRAVALFDLDGVLVDTQDAETLALLRFAESVHADVPVDDFAELVAGRRMQESVDLIGSYSRLAMPSDAVARVRKLAEEFLVDRLRAVPGVEQALAAWTGEKYVVSNSPLDMIVDRLNRTGLSGYFKGPHFSAYELATWKPEPGLYLAALNALNIGADDAIAIEDSEVGVRAAEAAGIRVCWYRLGAATAQSWSSLIRIVGDMAALADILGEGGRQASRTKARMLELPPLIFSR